MSLGYITGFLVTSPKGNRSYRNPYMVVDLGNKETLISFSYVHAVRPFGNSD